MILKGFLKMFGEKFPIELYDAGSVSEANQWAINVTANGGTYTANHVQYLDTFMNSISSFKNKIKRLNLCVGSDELARLTPIIYQLSNGGILDIKEGYATDLTSGSAGLKSTGNSIDSAKRINTNYYVYNDSSILNTHNQLIYWHNGETNEDGYSMYTPSIYLALDAKFGGNQYGRNFHNTVYSSCSLPSASGLHAWRRQGTTMKLFKNGVAVYTDSAAGTATAKVNTPLYYLYGAQCETFGNGISEDLTDAENLTLYNAWNTLNTSLGR